jgi:hypothetical protein
VSACVEGEVVTGHVGMRDREDRKCNITHLPYIHLSIKFEYVKIK